MNTLKHIAIIMDGNGRWAKNREMLRMQGHIEGAKNIKRIANTVFSSGVNYLSLYAFSTENWNRPQKEVEGLVKLFNNYLEDVLDNRININYKVRLIGNRSVWNSNTLKLIDKVESMNPESEYQLNVCFNYGGRGEIVDAVNKLIQEGKTEISENDITNNIYTGAFPPPDMLVRTGKEKRLSNFFLWQSAYSELFFSDTLWPDFSEEEIKKLIEEYYSRNRRFGEIE